MNERNLDIDDVRTLVDEYGVEPVIESYLERVEERNSDLNAFVDIFIDDISEVRPEDGDLFGVPIGIKDAFMQKTGEVSSFGSPLLLGSKASETSPVIERLLQEGAVILGSTNTAEFGHKGTTDNLIYGPTSTAHDLNKNAGGSSGGAAAAVEAGMVPAAIGSDAGGSVRIPAALTGTYGLKPSHGLIPQENSPNPQPFICLGPIANNAKDAAKLLEKMAGPTTGEGGDNYSKPEFNGNYANLQIDPENLDIAYNENLDVFPVHPIVEQGFENTVENLSERVEIEEVDIGLNKGHREITDLWKKIVSAEYAHVAETFPAYADNELRPGENISEDLYEMIKKGEKMSAKEYLEAENGADQVGNRVKSVFDDYDILLTPTVGAPYIENDGMDTVGPSEIEGEKVDEIIGWALTHPFNYTPNPVASLPACEIDGNPIGIQVAGKYLRDDQVISASYLLEDTLK